MLTQAETAVVVRRPPAKTLQLLRKLWRQPLRVLFVLVSGLMVAAGALAIWWLRSLNGLPDIGEPFDVRAFQAFSVPDEQNAFIFLRRSHLMLTPWPELPRAVDQSTPTVAWSKADPKVRAWVDANRQALDLFLEGAERPEAAQVPGKPSTDLRPLMLSLLAVLEGS